MGHTAQSAQIVRWHIVFSVACTLLLAVLLSGCGLPWPFPQPTPDPILPDAQQILRPLESGPNAGDLDSLDPAQIQFGFDYGMAQLIFPPLVTLDEKQQPVDWAAESHEVSADGLTYTFHLHHGMIWADGTPIDATTFAYSINRTLDPCLASGVSYYLYNLAGAQAFNNGACPAGAIKSTATLIGSSIQTPDPLTLRLTLAHPAGYFLSKLTWPTSWAVPQALIEKYTTRDSYGGTKSTWTDHLLDTGSFGGNLYLLTKWLHTQTSPTGRGSLIFARNERFWGKKPLLRRIEYTLYKDVSVEWSDFTAGKGDVSGFPSAQLTMARALKGVTVKQTPLMYSLFLTPNARLAPFDDVRMRQALSLALDRNALIQAVSLALDHNTLTASGTRPFVQATLHLLPDGVPGFNPDLTDMAGRTGTDALAPDLDAARRLASAYVANHCSGEYSKCPPIVFLRFNKESFTYLALMQAIMDQWQRAFPGWMTQVVEVAGVEIPPIPPHQLSIEGWPADYPDPQEFLSQRWTSTAPANSIAGNDAITLPQVDAWLSQADGMVASTARLALYQQAEQLLLNQAATFPVWQYLQTYAMRAHVSGWSSAATRVTSLSVWQSVHITR